MTKRIIAFVASLAVIVGLMNCGSSYAWFVTSFTKKQSISILTVSSVHSAYLTDLESSDTNIIMQGDNLISLDGRDATLKIENKSSTDTQLRISVEYTSYATGNRRQVKYSASESDDIEVKFADDMWAKNVNAGNECYFYYLGYNNGTGTVDSVNDVPAITPATTMIDAITSIAYKDSISYAYSGQKINIKIKFEMKQAEDLLWQTIDSYEISGTANA